jgi:phospholipase C
VGGGPPVTPPTPIPAACSTISDIEHVVILIQENRSFDHYFGSYRSVRGFSDQSMAFQQPDPDPSWRKRRTAQDDIVLW